ncbi:hypothetical protein [Allorhizocola rhizosphaerae]|uniref:hypothetical protein n=1 Tax=Allorhizocola rhizosphaerae TaxID=1872709 RepID=UPI000E3CF6BA|nr:hypothetical protein [Allorhizocola rhizosphaerae]
MVEQSGLSLSEIEELAAAKGYVLPEQIVATALSNDALPPQQLVVALVRSIGTNDREVKYWVEVLWRLESRAAYDPAQADQEHERKAPRDIEQIYGPEDEPGPSEPYVVPAPYDVGRVPDVDEAYEQQYAAPMSYEAGQVPGVAEPDEFPQHYGAEQGQAVGEAYGAESHPGERSSRAGMHRLRDDEDDDGGHADDAQLLQHHETQDTGVVRPGRPRIRHLATRPIRRVNRKARWPLPVAVGLSVMLVVSVVSWMAFGGDDDGKLLPDAAGSRPGGTHNPTRTGSGTTGGPGSPTVGEGGLPSGAPEVIPGTSAKPPANPEIPNPPPTTQGPGPDPVPTQTRTYGTQLSGTGSTSCTAEGGQWRVRILVNVTVSDPPPGLAPQGQAGLSGSMQGFSLSGGGTSYSGSTTISVGSSSSPNVGTVQWVVTMSVPGGRTARDESFEGYSCS